MENRALSEEEKKKIFELYENPFKFKFGEWIGFSIAVFPFFLLLIWGMEDFLGAIGLEFIFIFTLLIGLTFALLKLKKRKKLFNEAFSSSTAVEIHFFEINRYTKTPIYKSEYTAYLCETHEEKTLHFASDSNLGSSLNKNIKIEVVYLESPLVLKTTNCSSNENAIEVNPTDFITGLMQEIAEYEFSVHDENFDTYFE